MRKIQIIIPALFLSIVQFSAYSQLPDGVSATQTYLAEVIKNYNNEKSFPFDLNNITTHIRIPLEVHVVRNKKGNAGIANDKIYSSVGQANFYFNQVGMSFFIDTIDYVNDYNYSFITYNYLKKELLAEFTVRNRINLFLVDSIQIGSVRTYGFTYFPDQTDSNYVYIDKKYLTGNSLTTMLGHFMGLLSTHETAGGREEASERNCSESGDFICDTYADPGLFNEVIDSCKYIGNQRDDAGNYYIPSIANIMSDSPDRCRCVLTPVQYRRIYFYYLKYRQYLTY
jgi:hypothetical protein